MPSSPKRKTANKTKKKPTPTCVGLQKEYLWFLRATLDNLSDKAIQKTLRDMKKWKKDEGFVSKQTLVQDINKYFYDLHIDHKSRSRS